MLPFVFHKERAAILLNAIENGEAIEPPPGGWNTNDILQVAGAFFFAAMTRGPAMYLHDSEKFSGLHPEHRELTEEQFFGDLHAVIQFESNLTMAVCDDEYDASFEPEVVGALTWNGDEHSAQVAQVRGFKSPK